MSATKLPATIALSTSSVGNYSKVTAVVTFADSSTKTFAKGYTGGGPTLEKAIGDIQAEISAYIRKLGLSELPSDMKLNAKGAMDDLTAAGLHTHVISDVTGLQAALDAKAVLTTTTNALATKPTVVAAPSTAADAGTAGTIAFDATHFYYCVSTGVWVRATLATW